MIIRRAEDIQMQMMILCLFTIHINEQNDSTTPVTKHPACIQTADFQLMTAHAVKSGLTSTLTSLLN